MPQSIKTNLSPLTSEDVNSIMQMIHRVKGKDGCGEHVFSRYGVRVSFNLMTGEVRDIRSEKSGAVQWIYHDNLMNKLSTIIEANVKEVIQLYASFYLLAKLWERNDPKINRIIELQQGGVNMANYSLKGLLPEITWESVSKTFQELSRLPLGYGMAEMKYSAIREMTKTMPTNLNDANERLGNGHKNIKGL